MEETDITECISPSSDAGRVGSEAPLHPPVVDVTTSFLVDSANTDVRLAAELCTAATPNTLSSSWTPHPSSGIVTASSPSSYAPTQTIDHDTTRTAVISVPAPLTPSDGQSSIPSSGSNSSRHSPAGGRAREPLQSRLNTFPCGSTERYSHGDDHRSGSTESLSNSNSSRYISGSRVNTSSRSYAVSSRPYGRPQDFRDGGESGGRRSSGRSPFRNTATTSNDWSVGGGSCHALPSHLGRPMGGTHASRGPIWTFSTPTHQGCRLPEAGGFGYTTDEGTGEVMVWSVVTATGTPPNKRSLHVAVVCENCMYVFGGYDGTARTNDLHRFAFETGLWTAVECSSVPPARDRHASVSCGNCLYVFGGYDGNNRVNDLWQFDATLLQWKQLRGSGDLPTPRHSHSAAQHNGSIYIFGGYDGNYRCDLYCYSIKRNHWACLSCKGMVPPARYRTSLVVWRNMILVFGGHDGMKHLNDFYELNLDSFVWTTIDPIGRSSIPSPRDSHTAVVLGDVMYLFGGSTGSAQNDLYGFLLGSREWRSLKASATLSKSSGEMGLTLSSLSPSTSVDGSSPTGLLSCVPCARFCHTAVVFGPSMYLFGGYDGQNRLSDFRRLQLVEAPGGYGIHRGSLRLDLKQFVNNIQFSDVTFSVEGTLAYAHKIMCVRCNYFRAMFLNDMRESRQVTPIVIPQVRYETFLLLLEYLYTDEVDASLDSAIDLFVVADQLDVQRLKHLTETKILSSIDASSAATILLAADRYHAISLRQHCIEFILRDFDSVSKTTSFKDMVRSPNGTELLLEILEKR